MLQNRVDRKSRMKARIRCLPALHRMIRQDPVACADRRSQLGVFQPAPCGAARSLLQAEEDPQGRRGLEPEPSSLSSALPHGFFQCPWRHSLPWRLNRPASLPRPPPLPTCLRASCAPSPAGQQLHPAFQQLRPSRHFSAAVPDASWAVLLPQAARSQSLTEKELSVISQL